MNFNKEHAHPDSSQARATPVGMRWLYRQIGYWQTAARDKAASVYTTASAGLIASYYKTLLIEAYEDGGTPP